MTLFSRSVAPARAMAFTLALAASACHQTIPDAAAPQVAACAVALDTSSVQIAYKGRAKSDQSALVLQMAGCLKSQPSPTLDPEWAVAALLFAGEQTEKAEDKMPYFDAAVQSAKKWIEAAPKSAPAHIALARAYGSYGEAKGIRESVSLIKPIRAELETAIAIDPAAQHGLAYVILGRVYHKVPVFFGGDNAKSMDMYREALKIDAQHATTLLWFSEVLAEEDSTEQRAEALTLLAKLADSPVDAEYPKDTAAEIKKGGQLAKRLGDEALGNKLLERAEKL